jgi:hypothetical protein
VIPAHTASRGTSAGGNQSRDDAANNSTSIGGPTIHVVRFVCF